MGPSVPSRAKVELPPLLLWMLMNGVPATARMFAMAALLAITVVPSFAEKLLPSTFKVPLKSFGPFKTSLPGPVLVRATDAAPAMSLEMVSVALTLLTRMPALALRVMPILPSLRVTVLLVPRAPPFMVTWLGLNATGGWPSDNGPVMSSAPPLMVARPE